VIQQACIASNDLFTVAELPTIRAWHNHHLAGDKERWSVLIGPGSISCPRTVSAH
jgi:hypothetical protein